MNSPYSVAGPSLYDKVVRVTHVYLGPAADRFIARQVQNHLNKPPQELTKADLLRLIDWIRVAVSLLTEDSGVIEEYLTELTKLASNGDNLNQKKKSYGRA